MVAGRTQASHAANDEQLRRCLRDLAAITALPAVWRASEPAAIAEGLADVLINVLNLRFVLVRLKSAPDEPLIECTRFDDESLDRKMAGATEISIGYGGEFGSLSVGFHDRGARRPAW